MNVEIKKVTENPNLVSKTIYEEINNWENVTEKESFSVFEINPDYCNGLELCDIYDIDPKIGVKCLIVEITKKESKELSALLVPINYRYNMNLIRKKLGAKTVSIAPLEKVLNETNMEYGSINPIGLPKEWKKYVDSTIFDNNYIVTGSGIKKSKLYFPSKNLLRVDNMEEVTGLKKN